MNGVPPTTSRRSGATLLVAMGLAAAAACSSQPPPPPPEPAARVVEEAPAAPATPTWGEVRWAKVTSNVRARPTKSSAVVGRLEQGEAVRVDFLQSGWYAVFPVDRIERDEAYALGYVYAPLLVPTPP